VFVNNKYLKIYMDIVNRGKSDRSLDYKEIHHIIPSSIGGANSKENLTTLTAKEHYIAHRLLTKITTGADKQKMFFAFWRMSNQGNLTPSKYETIRKQHSEFVRTFQTGRRWKQSDDAREKARLRSVGDKSHWNRTKNHSETSKKKMSEAKKGKKTGSENSFYGRNHTEETKAKFREREYATKKISCPHCGKEGKGVGMMKRWHFDNCKEVNPS